LRIPPFSERKVILRGFYEILERGLSMMLVTGAQPNFMKIYAILDASKGFNRSHSRPITFQPLHTDQLYDQQMSQSFPQNHAMPNPDVDLEVGSGLHAQQKA
jgi:UDP-N-acetylglucosamine 2-epimerase (non-hydrolysing)